MLVFYLIFQISCLFHPDLNSALQFSLAAKKCVAFVCRAQEWKWNGHFLGVCYSRRGCSKLKNVMTPSPLAAVSSLQCISVSLQLPSVISNTDLPLTHWNCYFFPLQICWQLRTYFRTLLSQSYTNGGPNSLELCPAWSFIVDHKVLLQAVAGRRNMIIMARLTLQHIFSKILEQALD